MSQSATAIPKTHFKQSTFYLFPGQGEQFVGMGKELAEEFPVVKDLLTEADDILGFPLSQLCFDGPEEELNETINAQPAVLAVSIATLAAFNTLIEEQSEHVADSSVPLQWVAGHSLGEYSALVAAGALKFSDALLLVRRRGELMKEAGEKQIGRMAAILGLSDEQVAEICAQATQSHGTVQIANYNCPGQIVISGIQEAVEAAMEHCKEAKAKKVVPLAVSVAAHSQLMAPATEELASAIDAIEIHTPQNPVIGNTTVQPLTTPIEIKNELVSQLTGSVRWTETIQLGLDNGISTFVELGPGKTLNSLVKRIDRKSTRISLNDPESISQAL
ncbi:MAG: ACP S-malonyltransferase [Chloroflexota bacterium]